MIHSTAAMSCLTFPQRNPNSQEESRPTPKKPRTIVSDNGTEIKSMTMLEWCQGNQIELHYITPGKPMQTDVVE